MPVETEIQTSHLPPLKAPRGVELTCKAWPQEAAMRMLMNNLDEEVAERPRDLVVYGGTGKAARNQQSLDAILASLKSLANEETLLVQAGKPVGIFKTHDYAPRVLIANSNLVGHWSSWEKFNELERAGLMMYGQMTAGSWIYIGSQGIIQGTFETLSAAGEKHFAGDLAGKLIVSGGMGGMGGAQPLAATMTGACFLGIDVDAERIKKRLKTGYCDFMVNNLDEALRILKNAIRKKEAVSVGLVGNCADIIPELAERGVLPDILTDQTSAHDPLNGYVPNGMTLEQALALRRSDPQEARAGHRRCQWLGAAHASHAAAHHQLACQLAAKMLFTGRGKRLECALDDALRADVDPRAGGHLAIHHQPGALQLVELLPA